MKEIKIQGYLTEEKLKTVLLEIFGEVECQKVIQLPYKRARVDFYIPYLRTIIEYNGDTHYTRSKTIQRDMALSVYCNTNNIRIVEIPYWLQLDTKTLYHFFGFCWPIIKDFEITTDFPHGFITDTCVLPCDFTVEGWEKFFKEYRSLINTDNYSIAIDVYKNIIHRANMTTAFEVIGDIELIESKKIFVDNYPT